MKNCKRLAFVVGASAGLMVPNPAQAGGWGYGDCCVPYDRWCCPWHPHVTDLPQPYPFVTPYQHSYLLHRGRLYRFTRLRPYLAPPRHRF